MPFEIEEIKNTIKKNPVPWAIGLAVAVGAGAYMLAKRGGDTGYITKAYPETPTMPEDIAAGPASPGDISDAMLQQLLEELGRQQHESLAELAQMNREFMEGLSKTLESYVSQTLPRQVQQPLPQIPVVQDIARKVETIASTPSITFHPKGTSYTPQQIDVMYQWAVEEQAAISRGAVGTSKTPQGLAQAGLTMRFYPTGHVAFVPIGQEAPPTPKESAPGWPSQKEIEARGQQKIAELAKITGRTGAKTFEEALAGMTQQQKIEALKKAGLY